MIDELNDSYGKVILQLYKKAHKNNYKLLAFWFALICRIEDLALNMEFLNISDFMTPGTGVGLEPKRNLSSG